MKLFPHYFNLNLIRLIELREDYKLKAMWNDTVIAESDDTIAVEGNHYFPPESINTEYFQGSDTHTRCFWKGIASYYNISVDGSVNKDGAWFYPEPKEDAKNIKNYVAFWHGVKVVD